jgi:hypothetical protein
MKRITPTENTLRVLIATIEANYGTINDLMRLKELIEKHFFVDVQYSMLEYIYMIDVECGDRELIYKKYSFQKPQEDG